MDFFERIPESERTFFKEAGARSRDGRGVAGLGPRAARGSRSTRGACAGYVAVMRLAGWSDHVGELRLVVDPETRGRGLGRDLARWALLQAVDCGLGKLVVEVVAEQDGAVAMFQALGFHAEGLLRDHVRDRDGELRDLVLLAHPVGDQWSAMQTAGIDDAIR